MCRKREVFHEKFSKAVTQRGTYVLVILDEQWREIGRFKNVTCPGKYTHTHTYMYVIHKLNNLAYNSLGVLSVRTWKVGGSNHVLTRVCVCFFSVIIIASKAAFKKTKKTMTSHDNIMCTTAYTTNFQTHVVEYWCVKEMMCAIAIWVRT